MTTCNGAYPHPTFAPPSAAHLILYFLKNIINLGGDFVEVAIGQIYVGISGVERSNCVFTNYLQTHFVERNAIEFNGPGCGVGCLKEDHFASVLHSILIVASEFNVRFSREKIGINAEHVVVNLSTGSQIIHEIVLVGINRGPFEFINI